MDLYDASYDIQCPSCKTTKYRNPHLKLMVNVCGHALCESCVKLYFIKESGQCPECEIVLKRSKFRFQVFEDPMVEKEIDIRRRVMKVYNKQEDDFERPDDWNNYIEEIENIVLDLVNDVNRSEIEKKLESYEKLHKDEIRRNLSKRSREEEELERLMEEERLVGEERAKKIQEELEKQRLSKERTKTTLLQDLLASEGDASLIVKSHADKLKEEQQILEEEMAAKSRLPAKATEFSSGIKIGFGRGKNANQKIIQKGTLYSYKAPDLPTVLQSPSWGNLDSDGFLGHVRKSSPQAMAGGYTEHYACLRALQEFMWGHILTPR
ncbi:CDK-activating kinase assembly factor [Oratosquilla oratoria]|uniref:CDK-activating kinase assembly factor n=1 Tax=Oratosquilla oratoria TaxID=337810 RepID=UPI003F764819